MGATDLSRRWRRHPKSQVSVQSWLSGWLLFGAAVAAAAGCCCCWLLLLLANAAAVAVAAFVAPSAVASCSCRLRCLCCCCRPIRHLLCIPTAWHREAIQCQHPSCSLLRLAAHSPHAPQRPCSVSTKGGGGLQDGAELINGPGAVQGSKNRGIKAKLLATTQHQSPTPAVLSYPPLTLS